MALDAEGPWAKLDGHLLLMLEVLFLFVAGGECLSLRFLKNEHLTKPLSPLWFIGEFPYDSFPLHLRPQ